MQHKPFPLNEAYGNIQHNPSLLFQEIVFSDRLYTHFKVAGT